MRTIGLTFPQVATPPKPPKEAPVKKEVGVEDVRRL